MRKYKERGGVFWLILAVIGVGVGVATEYHSATIYGVIMLVMAQLERISNGLNDYFNGEDQ